MGEERTVGGLGEFGLIAEMTARLPHGAGVLLGPGDDAALVAAGDGRVVASTDVLVEGRHFRRDWSTGYDVGRKAAAQNLADVAAMGARPTALLVGLVAPADLPVAWARGLADGLVDECARSTPAASVVGGDTCAGPQVVVAVTALGDLEGRPPVTRAGARPGDVVAVNGRLGWSAAGLCALLAAAPHPGPARTEPGPEEREVLPRPTDLDPGVPVEVLAAHLRPQPPYAAGPAAATAGATALCDVSDGLLADLGHIATASGVAVDIDPDLVPLDEPVRRAAAALGVSPLAWALSGGEDHALVGCFPAGAPLPSGWRRIGRTTAGSGVTVAGQVWTGPPGWDHYR